VPISERRETTSPSASRGERVASSQRLGAIAGFMVLLLLFAAVAVSGRVEPARARIEVRLLPRSGFTPSTITVPRGSTVTWVNDDKLPHTVTSTEGAFASQAIRSEESFAFRFDVPGTYSYFSGFQPQWAGRIVVR